MMVTKKVTVLKKYLNYAIIFSKKLAIELFKYFAINKYVFHLKLNEKLFYKLI